MGSASGTEAAAYKTADVFADPGGLRVQDPSGFNPPPVPKPVAPKAIEWTAGHVRVDRVDHPTVGPVLSSTGSAYHILTQKLKARGWSASCCGTCSSEEPCDAPASMLDTWIPESLYQLRDLSDSMRSALIESRSRRLEYVSGVTYGESCQDGTVKVRVIPATFTHPWDFDCVTMKPRTWLHRANVSGNCYNFGKCPSIATTLKCYPGLQGIPIVYKCVCVKWWRVGLGMKRGIWGSPGSPGPNMQGQVLKEHLSSGSRNKLVDYNDPGGNVIDNSNCKCMCFDDLTPENDPSPPMTGNKPTAKRCRDLGPWGKQNEWGAGQDSHNKPHSFPYPFPK